MKNNKDNTSGNSDFTHTDKVVNVFESRAYKKRKELLKQAYMNALTYGEEVELIGNSREIEILDYLIGSKGIVINRVNKIKKNKDGTVDYIVMFGELKVDVNSTDLKVPDEVFE